MKLVSVVRTLKELQNDTFRQPVPNIVVNTNTNALKTSTGTLRLCEVNLVRYVACRKQLAGKKDVIL